jgi:hypothetical protein
MSYIPQVVMELINFLDSSRPDMIYRSLSTIVSGILKSRAKIKEKRPNETLVVPSVAM